MNSNKTCDTYFKARNRVPGGRGRDGGAQTSRGALTVQKARMLHRYQLQLTFTKDFLQVKRERKQKISNSVASCEACFRFVVPWNFGITSRSSVHF